MAHNICSNILFLTKMASATVVWSADNPILPDHYSDLSPAVVGAHQIGQRHSGFLGLLQRALTRASSHIWFERGETKDRSAVTRRLKEHVDDPHKLPILIFPEGTCINNTSVMQFKKGSFEVGGTIYPVAIRVRGRA